VPQLTTLLRAPQIGVALDKNRNKTSTNVVLSGFNKGVHTCANELLEITKK
jgi:hypothetical protein